MSALISAVVVAGAGLGYSIHSGEQAKNRQQIAQRQGKKRAEEQESQADQAFNKANRRKPNFVDMLRANQQAAGTGGSGTRLTGLAGVNPASLNLGRSTLLGG